MSDDRIALGADELEALTAAVSERHTRGPVGVRYFRSEEDAAAATQADEIAEVLVASTRRVRTPEGARVYGQPIGTVITKDMVPRAAKAALKTGTPPAKGGPARTPPNKIAAVREALPANVRKEVDRVRQVMAMVPEKDRGRAATAVAEEIAGHMATKMLPDAQPKHKKVLESIQRKGREAHNVTAAISALYLSGDKAHKRLEFSEEIVEEIVAAKGHGKADLPMGLAALTGIEGLAIPNPFAEPEHFLHWIIDLFKELFMMKVQSSGGDIGGGHH